MTIHEFLADMTTFDVIFCLVVMIWLAFMAALITPSRKR